MFDIAGQLLPNLLTISVQLCATGVIFLVYKKYLHKPVLEIMDRKADDFQKAYKDVEKMKEEQIELTKKFEEEKEELIRNLQIQRQAMVDETSKLRETMIKEASDKADSFYSDAHHTIEKERIEMLSDLQNHVVSVSSQMVGKVLEGFEFDEGQMVSALEKELEKSHANS